MELHEEKERRKFARAGTIAAATYNVNRDSKKRAQPFTCQDIFPHLADGEENQEATAEAIDLFFTGLVAQYQKQHGTEGQPLVRKKVSAADFIH